MTSQTGKQIIAIYVLPNISRSKSNQTMKFCQLIGHNIGNSFPQIRQGGCFKISVFFALHEAKASGQHLSFNKVLNLDI